ncbi:MAG: tetratricopeptide repeat protein, partial [Bacteroidales bacterium]|nr:tetratricopeptide repeat protein [Bacteroidales bacterium]
IDEYNAISEDGKLMFKAIGWELTNPTARRPQDEINKYVRECDYFVVLLHDYFGSPTGSDKDYSSGTEEEFHVACESMGDENLPMRDVAIFFKSVPQDRMKDPGPNLQKVLNFRKEREAKKDFYCKLYNTSTEFADFFRRRLQEWKQDIVKGVKKTAKNPLLSSTEKSLSSKVNDLSYKTMEDGLKKAQELYNNGENTDAEILYSRLVADYDASRAEIEYARFLRNIGSFQMAMKVLEKARDKYIRLRDKENEAYAWQQIGKIHAIFIEHYEEAKVDYEKALELYNSNDLNKSLDNSICKARTLLNLGIILRRLSDYENSEKHLEQALNIFEEFKCNSAIATVKSHLGVLYKTIGDYDKALQYQKEALNILETEQTEQNPRAKAKVLGNLGVIYRIKRNFAEAKNAHQEALNIFIKVKDIRGQIREISNLGEIEEINKQYKDAFNYYEKAYYLAGQIGEKDGISMTQMGKISYMLGSYNESEKYLMEALQIAKDDKYSQSIRLRYLGILYRLKKDYSESIRYLNKSIENAYYIKNDVEIANALLEEAYTYFEQKDRKNALAIAEDTKLRFKELKMDTKEKEAESLIKKTLNMPSVV